MEIFLPTCEAKSLPLIFLKMIGNIFIIKLLIIFLAGISYTSATLTPSYIIASLMMRLDASSMIAKQVHVASTSLVWPPPIKLLEQAIIGHLFFVTAS